MERRPSSIGNDKKMVYKMNFLNLRKNIFISSVELKCFSLIGLSILNLFIL